MTGSIHSASFKRQANSFRLQLTDGTVSQWLDAATYRSAFCIAKTSQAANWTIEGLLEDGETIVLADYSSGDLFNPSMPRYIAMNAMCGLPIRFVSDQSQSNSQLWVVFKS